MPSTLSGAALPAAPPLAAVARLRTRRFYLVITLVLIGMVVWGFWPTYFGRMLGAGVDLPWLLHVHGAIYSGWMLLLLAQVVLVATGRVRLHRRIGNAGIAYGFLVLAIGLVVTFAAPAMRVRAGEWTFDYAAGFLLLPLVDMVLFGAFFGAAVAYRARPEIHKRFILAATVAVVFAAVARALAASPAMLLVVWLSPMAAAMAFDLWTRGRIHPVHYVTVTAMGVAFLRLFFMETEGWLRIGRALLAPAL